MPEFTPSRRSVIRTAAWSVPAITVATAAPAFAASEPIDPTLPNLSTSQANAVLPSRTGNQVSIPPTTLVNTGGSDGVGVVIKYVSDGPTIDAIDFDLSALIPGLVVPAATAADGGVTGMGSREVTLTVLNPLTGAVLIPAGDPNGWSSPATQILTMSEDVAFDLTVTATAANGGVPYAPPVQSF